VDLDRLATANAGDVRHRRGDFVIERDGAALVLVSRGQVEQGPHPHAIGAPGKKIADFSGWTLAASMLRACASALASLRWTLWRR
jgi:hypothetical protein